VSRKPRGDFQRLNAMNIQAGQIKPGEFPTDRFVAFIDILGFRDLIGRMFSDEPSLFTTLLNALELTKGMAGHVDPQNVRAVTAFSDSVVISEGGPFGTAGVLATVMVLAGELLKKGILCRGGIAVGRTYHANGVVFGEGLLRAYDLERTVANTARIVVDDHVAPSIFFLIDDPIPHLKRDQDGRLVVNVFNYFWEAAEIETQKGDVGEYLPGAVDVVGLSQARQGLEAALRRARSVGRTDIVEKVVWIINEFNETIDAFPDIQIPPIDVE